MPTSAAATKPGHRAKFLVVVDDTEECDRGRLFRGSARALRAKARMVLLRVIETAERNQQLARRRRHHARPRRMTKPNVAARHLRPRAPMIAARRRARTVIREGNTRRRGPQADRGGRGHRACCVLAAGTGKEGPGRWSRLPGQVRRHLPDPGRDRARAPRATRSSTRHGVIRRLSWRPVEALARARRRHLSADSHRQPGAALEPAAARR